MKSRAQVQLHQIPSGQETKREGWETGWMPDLREDSVSGCKKLKEGVKKQGQE